MEAAAPAPFPAPLSYFAFALSYVSPLESQLSFLEISEQKTNRRESSHLSQAGPWAQLLPLWGLTGDRVGDLAPIHSVGVGVSLFWEPCNGGLQPVLPGALQGPGKRLSQFTALVCRHGTGVKEGPTGVASLCPGQW